jgi:diaminohydroxyphosphoribosylaminopyrimidine deaminase/5-amino-6-(5-phosphoribosylamino)uracil reductase
MGVDLPASLAALADRGITRLLVEGGASLAAAMLREGLVDRVAWFHAPGVIGGDGFPAAQAFGIQALADMPRFRRVSSIPLGEDMLTELHRIETGS